MFDLVIIQQGLDYIIRITSIKHCFATENSDFFRAVAETPCDKSLYQ